MLKIWLACGVRYQKVMNLIETGGANCAPPRIQQIERFLDQDRSERRPCRRLSDRRLVAARKNACRVCHDFIARVRSGASFVGWRRRHAFSEGDLRGIPGILREFDWPIQIELAAPNMM